MNPHAKWLGAEAALDRKNWAEAEAGYRAALALEDGHVPSLIVLSTVLSRRGAHREAHDAAMQAARRQPQEAPLLYGLGQRLRYFHEFEALERFLSNPAIASQALLTAVARSVVMLSSIGTDPWISNADYPLWRVVRASTAAPSFFDPEKITIAREAGRKPVVGEFVDGGASPFNNPALQAFMYATMDGYRIGWPTGADRLLLVSVGTGAADSKVKKANLTAQHAIGALLSLMDDCAALQETLLQWMSSSPTAREIDREPGDLRHDLVAGAPLLSYLRYNVDLRTASLQRLDPNMTDPEVINSLSEMDSPENMALLHRLGKLAAERDVKAGAFRGMQKSSTLKPYSPEAGLALQGLSSRKTPCISNSPAAPNS